MFDSVEQVLEALAKEQYIGDKKIATVVFLAHKLEKQEEPSFLSVRTDYQVTLG